MKIPSLLLAAGAFALLQPVLGRPFDGQSPLQARSLPDETNELKPRLVSYEPKYKGHALVRFRPEANALSPVLARGPIDIWATLPSGEKVARLTPDQIKVLRAETVLQGKEGWQIVQEDLQDLVQKETEAINRNILANHPYRRALEGELERGRLDYSEWFKHYHRYEEIKRFAQQLAVDFPNIVRFVPSIGQRTWEGRTIFALRLTSPKYAPSKASKVIPNKRRKPQIFFQGVQHAREYISGTTVQYLAHHYASNYGKDPKITSLLDRAEIVIILIANPDGYVHAWDHDRYWRKNKRSLGNNTYGVDLNRNWDEHWGGEGSSNDPTAENFRGLSAASEPETQALQNYFLTQGGGNVVAAIDFHCYAELILRPLGWSNDTAPHEPELLAASTKLRDVLLSVHAQNFTLGRTEEIGQYASGSAMDYFYASQAKAKRGGLHAYSYTIELRPTLEFEDGFKLPEEQIVLAGEEVAAGMDWFMDHALENPLGRK